jgi:plastocyanin
MAKASTSGDGQSGPSGTTLPNPLRVVITQSGAPVSGRGVFWAITPAGGAVSPASGPTMSDGIAQTTVTLPGFATTSTITATSAGVTGSPVSFTAISTGASLQVLVAVVNNAFQPSEFQLKQGGTVSFVWGTGSVQHTVTPVAPNTIPVSPGDPATQNAPFEFSTVFPTTGTFAFFCRTHGTATTGMHGTITVVAP